MQVYSPHHGRAEGNLVLTLDQGGSNAVGALWPAWSCEHRLGSCLWTERALPQEGPAVWTM